MCRRRVALAGHTDNNPNRRLQSGGVERSLDAKMCDFRDDGVPRAYCFPNFANKWHWGAYVHWNGWYGMVHTVTYRQDRIEKCATRNASGQSVIVYTANNVSCACVSQECYC